MGKVIQLEPTWPIIHVCWFRHVGLLYTLDIQIPPEKVFWVCVYGPNTSYV